MPVPMVTLAGQSVTPAVVPNTCDECRCALYRSLPRCKKKLVASLDIGSAAICQSQLNRLNVVSDELWLSLQKLVSLAAPLIVGATQ